jgi:alpha-D-ribose 1-methylphosphonate 5-triphosphate synthase subunit PhnG
LDPDIEARRAAMAILAEAEAQELSAGLDHLSVPAFTELRSPESGLVMLRGRMGGDGGPFNLGEATVTRAAIRLETGETGFSYLLGHRPEAAKLAALADALWQRPALRADVERLVLAPIRARMEAEDRQSAARTAATRVEFFTLVRGEDAR